MTTGELAVVATGPRPGQLIAVEALLS